MNSIAKLSSVSTKFKSRVSCVSNIRNLCTNANPNKRVKRVVHEQRTFSGIQPTGDLHLGNYLGAVQNWLNFQKAQTKPNELLICVVDLHSLTTVRNFPTPPDYRTQIREMTAALIACGIDPSQTILFNQSKVSQHAELKWILGCFTPLGWLYRMTQFKDKSAGKEGESVPLGLLSYPVLQAADILLYKATQVPVGEDQEQHLELARDVANMFNSYFKKDFFPAPKSILTPTKRVMSLKNANEKMSKSNPNDNTRINLTDTADQIASKIRKATTDTTLGITWDPENRKEVANLLSILSAVTGKSIEELVKECEGYNHAKFKETVSDALVATIAPIGVRIAQIKKEPGYVDKVLDEGGKKAIAIAETTFKGVKDLIGLI